MANAIEGSHTPEDATADPTDLSATIPAGTDSIYLFVSGDVIDIGSISLDPAGVNQAFTEISTDVNGFFFRGSLWYLDSPSVTGSRTVRIDYATGAPSTNLASMLYLSGTDTATGSLRTWDVWTSTTAPDAFTVNLTGQQATDAILLFLSGQNDPTSYWTGATEQYDSDFSGFRNACAYELASTDDPGATIDYPVAYGVAVREGAAGSVSVGVPGIIIGQAIQRASFW